MQCDVFNPQASEGVQPMHRRTSTTTVTLPNFFVVVGEESCRADGDFHVCDRLTVPEPLFLKNLIRRIDWPGCKRRLTMTPPG